MDQRQSTPPRDPFRHRPREPFADARYGDEQGYERRFDEDYGPPPPRSRGRGFDPASLFVLLDAVRRAVPRELDDRVSALIREFLLTLRSLIDWYLERLDRPRREPEVEEIRID